ncbi:response regulator [candidate division WWE3 bacterium CG_4_9_14_0_2_um_filter_35_11]|uniref:Response regulator n=1 Tax=candidate division WWE3 bacterium CG_4_9_14_0_2_um_filter_35_11 TaxID=1975077 RepID=A0A2M8ELG1_UNCKA|nr:MAG: response regulator [candidate division WWE3 bacterium CG_4_9_14_0_2_um_filter_35_11]
MVNKKYKILIVEDEASLRFVYSEYLDMEGFEVIQAEDGREALDLVKTNPDIDVILLDLMIPKIDGIKVLEKIRSNPKNKSIKIFVMTVLSREKVIKEAFDLGADDYLIKDSLTPDQIKEEIISLLEPR